MKLERYDALIWRMNGTLLLLVCVGATFICLFAGYKAMNGYFATAGVHDIVNVDQNTKKETFLRLGYFESLKGTDLLFIPLSLEQKLDISYSQRGNYGRAKNYLVFNTKSKETYWVFKETSLLFLGDTKIFDQITNESTQNVKGIVFESVEKDSNSDGVVNEDDEKAIRYFDLTSKKSVTIVSQIDRFMGVKQSSNDEVLFFYSRSGKSYFKSLSVSGLSASEEKEIGLPL